MEGGALLSMQPMDYIYCIYIQGVWDKFDIFIFGYVFPQVIVINPNYSSFNCSGPSSFIYKVSERIDELNSLIHRRQ